MTGTNRTPDPNRLQDLVWVGLRVATGWIPRAMIRSRSAVYLPERVPALLDRLCPNEHSWGLGVVPSPSRTTGFYLHSNGLQGRTTLVANLGGSPQDELMRSAQK